MPDLRGKVPKVERVCVDGSKAMHTTIVKVIKLVRDGTEMKRTNAKLTDRNTNREAELVEARAVKGTMQGQLLEGEHQIAALKTQSANAHLACKKLMGGKSRTEASLHAQVAAAEESLTAERTRVEHLEREVAADSEKRQQLLVKRQKTSQTASCQFAENGESLQDLQFKTATVTAE